MPFARTLVWKYPATPAGPIDGFRVSVTPVGGDPVVETLGSAARSLEVSLLEDVAYDFTVTAFRGTKEASASLIGYVLTLPLDAPSDLAIELGTVPAPTDVVVS